MTALQQLGASTYIEVIDPNRVVSLGQHGFGYTFQPASPPIPGMVVRGDSNEAPLTSTAVLTEDGKVLGPAHSDHASINTLGSGRFSHWGAAALVFSASDGSDPKTNGRSYALQYRYAVPSAIMIAAAVLLSLTLGAFGRMPTMSPVARQDSGAIGGLRNFDSLGDWTAIFVFVAVAFVCQALLLRGHGPVSILWSGDAGNVASFVAGWMHPERFASDLVLSDSSNFRFYITVVLPYVAVTSLLTNDIGKAYLFLYFPMIFFQLFGFYLLGKRLFKTRFWAIVLALLTVPPVWIWGGNELWGVFHLPLVRMSFEALLPYLLMLFLTRGSDAKALPWLFAICGVTVYAHPVSAPAVAAALACGSLALVPRGKRFLDHARRVVVASLVFLAVAMPFALVFFKGFPGFESTITIRSTEVEREAAAIFRERNGDFYYDAIRALGFFVEHTGANYAFVWVTGLASFLLVPLLNPEQKRVCLFFGLFLVGVLLASVGVALIDQRVSALLGRSPAQLDLIRSLRFVIPIMLLGTVLLASELHSTFARQGWAILAAPVPTVMIILALWWWHVWPTRLANELELAVIPEAYTSPDRDASQMLAFMRSLPANSSVLPLGSDAVSVAVTGLAVRYGSLQPVVYLDNDMNALFYSGSARRLEWARFYKIISSLLSESDEAAAGSRLNTIIGLARPKYLLLKKGAAPSVLASAAERMGTVVRQHGRWSLIEVSQPGAHP